MKKGKLTALCITVGLFVIMAALVLTDVFFLCETNFYDGINITSSGITGFKIITYFGSVWVICGLVLLFILLPWTRKKYGYPVCASALISVGLTNLIKVITKRPRPEILQLVSEKGYSFPSGHACSSTAVFVLIAIILFKTIKNNKIRIPLAILCCSIPILVAFSRVYLGVHYLGDVLCGMLLGLIVALVVNIAWGLLDNRMKEGKLRKFLF